MNKAKAFVYLDCLLIFYSLFIGSRSESNQRPELFDEVAPPDYDHLTLPSKDGEAVIVNVSISNLNIRSVDENDMSFTASIEVWQGWFDTRLQFPARSKKHFQILDSLWINKIWTPKLYFSNSVEGKMNNIMTPSSFFWLTPPRRIYYCCRLVIKFMCEMNLRHFPHDEQKCGVKMSSAIYSDQSVQLYWFEESKKHDKLSSLQQFKITSFENEFCCGKIGTTNSSCLEKTFIMSRRSGYYVINIYIPTILIVMMSQLTFWIPADAIAARSTLGVTSLLTIITKQYQASMPNVSYIVAMNIWLAACISFVFISLLEFVTVVILNTRIKKLEKKPSVSSDFVIPVKTLTNNDNLWKFPGRNGIMVKAKKSLKLFKKTDFALHPNTLDCVSRIIFPISFFVFCIAYGKFYS